MKLNIIIYNMKLIYKYIVLIIIIFIIIYKCSQKSINIEHLDEENNVYLDEGNIDTLKFNMDKFRKINRR